MRNYSINKIILFAGKGPQKEFYKNKIEKEEWKHVKFCLPWLESEDYPVLLGNKDGESAKFSKMY
jgi:hypothetical protein